MREQKRIAAIHDISCLGKCSLTVALPIISAAGIETSVIPTAVLSTHTGGFTGYTFRDLTEDIEPIAEHWKSLDIGFDGIYTGYLGSIEQVEIVAGVINALRGEDTLLVVDPVMADDGKLYVSFPPEFPEEMKKLCRMADVIVPNITEASLLLNVEYKKGPYSTEYIEDMLKALAGLGPDKIVLTGVCFDETRLGAASYDAKSGKIEYAFENAIPGLYHGTGDVFASALVSGLLNGKTLEESCEIAVSFTVKSIERTRAAGTPAHFGVNFETELPGLMKDLGIKE